MPLRLLAPALFLISAPAHADNPVSATVAVTGQKEAVARQLDKTVHQVSSMPQAASGSVQDLLQAIPELSVSSDGRIASIEVINNTSAAHSASGGAIVNLVMKRGRRTGARACRPAWPTADAGTAPGRAS